MKKSDTLLLKDHLSFPLYACSREMVKRCRVGLDALGLTYTQYIVMLVIWEAGVVSVRDLGRRLFLDSGTLTPVLKTLEQQQFVTRERSKEDERILLVSATAKGAALREEALAMRHDMTPASGLTAQEEAQLSALLDKMLSASKK